MKTLWPVLYWGMISALLIPFPGFGTESEPGDGRTQWISGSGCWTNADHWSQGVPTFSQRVEVHGNSSVVIPPGTYWASDLKIGLDAGDRSWVEVNGGQLVLMQDSLRVGEYSGSQGAFALTDGALHCVMDVFVGAASSVPGRATQASLRITGGSFLGRTLTVGVGLGAKSTVSIEGSRATAVHVLDYAYFEGLADADDTPGVTTLSFTLDQHGVTPITIQSRADGLRIVKDAKSHCRLEIHLSAIPPRDDITLVSAHVATRGTFDDLPEGSEISAPYQNHLYRWQLTYRGGASGHDLVLKNRSEYPGDAPVTHSRPLPEIPKPLWTVHPVIEPILPQGETAFAGAEGFGAYTPGGRGGKVLFVTNLNDSGPGSLRAAIETTGPRIIRFRVGGVIPLQSVLTIREPYVTIDGGDAPGNGILVRNHGIHVMTHDVVLRYFRVRVGGDAVRTGTHPLSYYEGGEGDYALYFVEGARNCIADHLSLSWSTSKMLSTTKGSDLITIQWCVLSESLNFADHGYASIAGGNRLTWHHNLFAHHQSRNVRFQGMVDADFRNNVIYDWGDTAAYGEFDRLNYVGNYLKAGPSTAQERRLFHTGKEVVAAHSLFVTSNILEGEPKVNQDNWRGMGYYYFDRALLGAAAPFPAPSVTTEPPSAAYEHVLKDAGATLPKRDSVDERIVREVRGGTGHIVRWVEDAGGWPDFPSATAP